MIKIIIGILFIKVTLAQIDGNFRWLNNKISKLTGQKPSRPRFEDDSRETNNKIVFVDEYLSSEITTTGTPLKKTEYKRKDKILWPSDIEKYIDNNGLSNNIIKNIDSIIFKPDAKEILSHKICTYMPKSKCIQENGNIPFGRITQTPQAFKDRDLICCLLSYPQKLKRNKRSHDENNTAIKQRNILLLRKYKFSTTKPTSRPEVTDQKIVTPDEDYVDPYWNIKNTNFQKPNLKPNKNNNYQDYEDSYVTEIPKPFVGIYFGKDEKQTNCRSNKGNKFYSEYPDYDTVENSEAFGYGNIDPKRSTEKIMDKVKPTKQSTSSSELLDDIDNPTIVYQSTSDFKVLQGFKLLHSVRNKNKINEMIKNSTTEIVAQSDKRNALLNSLSPTYSYRDEHLRPDYEKDNENTEFNKY